jgi:hypothetical protein
MTKLPTLTGKTLIAALAKADLKSSGSEEVTTTCNILTVTLQ